MVKIQFIIKNKEGKSIFCTNQESCIPIDTLDSMKSAGFSFYLDGVRISVVHLIKKFSVLDKEILHTTGTGIASCNNTDNLSSGNIPLDADFPITSRTIVCLNTGKLYRTQKEASEDLGVDPSWISYCISNKCDYKGYRFKKALEL